MAGEQIDLAVLRMAALVSVKISQGYGLDDTLQAVADGVVDALGFGAAAVNYALANGNFQVLAVAGPAEARDTLTGAIVTKADMDNLLERSVPWGDLRFVPGGESPDVAHTPWTPEFEVVDEADAWQPDDALLVPLRASDGAMVGVLSVDLPPDRRRPGPLLRELLEMFAVQAGLAIDKARLVSQLREEHARLLASEAAFRFSFTGSAGPMGMLSLASESLGGFEQVNDAFCRAVHYSRDRLADLCWMDLVVPEERTISRSSLLRFAAGQRGSHHSERQLIRGDGTVIWARTTVTVIVAAETDVAPFLLLHIEDITERKAREQSLARQAQMDPLTGLANRRLLVEYLETVVADGYRAEPGFIFYADLDRFKRINDRYGHAAGDEVLRETAARLKTHVRSGDVVARVGGDEFVIVAVGLSPADAEGIAGRIRNAFTSPMTGVEETVNMSLGAAPLDVSVGGDVEILIHRADRAMYADKPPHHDEA